jgi:membrane protease YdiL (CAAX protease family)
MIEPSYRKPVGVLLILLLIIVWSVIVASLSSIVGGWHIGLQSIFYLAAGTVWILPLRPLLMWMETGKWRE